MIKSFYYGGYRKSLFFTKILIFPPLHRENVVLKKFIDGNHSKTFTGNKKCK
jgi:hypothetical protein